MTPTKSFCTLFHLRVLLPWLYRSSTLFVTGIHGPHKDFKIRFFSNKKQASNDGEKELGTWNHALVLHACG